MPSYLYAAPSPSRLDARVLFDRLADGLLEQGGIALRPLQSALNRPGGSPADAGHAAALRRLVEEGYLDQEAGKGDELRVGPRGVRRCEELSLMELFGRSGGSQPGSHLDGSGGTGPEPGLEPRPYVPGEPLVHLDLSATLANALTRSGPSVPLRLSAEDVVVRPPEPSRRCSTVVLLDMSGSMARHGKFAAARRAALAFRSLVRRRFPGDEVRVAGFATRAVPLNGAALLEAAPLPVGLVEDRAQVRLPASAAFDPDPGRSLPQHFTNIQAALRLARRWLRHEGTAGKQIVLITDGEPTAHLEGNELVLAYPATPESARHTLGEARRCAAENISLSIHALLTDMSSPGLDVFVRQLARAGRGHALCERAGQLGRSVLLRFLQTRHSTR